ncbi:MAG TPA: glycosyltransferase family 4 protein [Vicinamibacterales bacterium]
MMRIAYVCSDPGVPVFGHKGCSVHVTEMLRAFARCGAHVEVFAARSDGRPPTDLQQVRVHLLPGWANVARAARPMSAGEINVALGAALDRSGPFDLVYERYSLWSTAAMEHARAVGIPGLLEVNAPLIDEEAAYRGPLDELSAAAFTRQSFSAATALIAVSKSITDYAHRYRDTRDGVYVVPNGVDPDRFAPELAASLPAPDGVFTVGFVGSLKPWHGVMTMASAFRQLHRHASKTRLLVVGDGPERDRLLGYLATHNLLQVTTLTGAVAASEVPGLLASMDVGMAPYSNCRDFYFSPLKVYEYMAAGLAVVGSDLGQIAEVVEHGVDGWLCAPDDPRAWTTALKLLQRNPGIGSRLGQAARQKVSQHHTWDAAALRVLDLARGPLRQRRV